MGFYFFGGAVAIDVLVANPPASLRCWPNPIDEVGITPSCAGWDESPYAVETRLPRLRPDIIGSLLLLGSPPANVGSPASI